MKNAILMFCLAFATTLHAQIFRDVKVRAVEGTQAGDVRTAGLSADGRYAFTTSQTNRGLCRIDLETGRAEVLTADEGAGYQPAVSADGQHVLVRSTTFGTDRLRRTSVHLIDTQAGTSEQLLAPSREQGAFAFADGEAVLVKENGLNRRRVRAKRHAEERPLVYLDDELQLMIRRGDATEQLSPNGNDEDTRYLWPSLSPDGRHILYYVCEEGAYVCDVNGENVQFLSARLQAPQWYDDNTIVGMDARDDGEFFLSSCIVAMDLQGHRQQLTDPALGLMYPYCSAEARRIVCSRLSGEVMMIEVSLTHPTTK